MRDELTFNAEDNDVAPDSPISFQMECNWIIINQLLFNNELGSRCNWMSDELTFNASDNDVAPESPILFQMGCDWIIIN